MRFRNLHTRIVKRLRVLYAAWRQDWNQETCRRCQQTWWVDRRAVPSGLECQDCEDRHFNQWLEDYEQQQQRKGAA